MSNLPAGVISGRSKYLSNELSTIITEGEVKMLCGSTENPINDFFSPSSLLCVSRMGQAGAVNG